MTTFDRLKLVAPLTVVSVINEELFEYRINNGMVHSAKYDNGNPKLVMNVNYQKKEFVIEFTR